MHFCLGAGAPVRPAPHGWGWCCRAPPTSAIETEDYYYNYQSKVPVVAVRVGQVEAAEPPGARGLEPTHEGVQPDEVPRDERDEDEAPERKTP